MNKFTIPAAVIAMLAAMSAADASTATATIKSMDTTSDTLTLSNGRVYTVPMTMSMADWHVGDRVKVVYKLAKGTRTVSKVTVTKAATKA